MIVLYLARPLDLVQLRNGSVARSAAPLLPLLPLLRGVFVEACPECVSQAVPKATRASMRASLPGHITTRVSLPE
ncbi:unnamed protein product [Lampetra fluviatilis]